jgi:hypothetical protein
MGGLMNYGYQCGMLWGAALAAGAQAYRLFGPGPQAEAEAIYASQRLVDAFRDRNKNEFNCLEITDLNFKGKIQGKQLLKFFIKGGPIGCLRMSAGYAREAFSEINTAFSENHFEELSHPVSCTAMMAQKMGLSDLHTVMVAGFAGGIGLCGGACGALGAAIWIIGMNCLEGGIDEKYIYYSEAFQSRVTEAIDRFLESADYDFECAEIVGRKFENIDDHADHLRAGGCTEIIEAFVFS